MSEKVKKKRNKFELWLDQYNHTMELVRTGIAFIVLLLQLIILYRLAQ